MCLHATTGRWDAAYGRSGAAVDLLARPSGKGVGTDENITRDGLLKLAGLAAAGGAAGLAVPARAGAQATEDYAILYVSQDGRDSNAGRSWENAKREVQGALDLVQPLGPHNRFDLDHRYLLKSLGREAGERTPRLLTV